MLCKRNSGHNTISPTENRQYFTQENDAGMVGFEVPKEEIGLSRGPFGLGP